MVGANAIPVSVVHNKYDNLPAFPEQNRGRLRRSRLGSRGTWFQLEGPT